jgi:hypothetical protein
MMQNRSLASAFRRLAEELLGGERKSHRAFRAHVAKAESQRVEFLGSTETMASEPGMEPKEALPSETLEKFKRSVA